MKNTTTILWFLMALAISCKKQQKPITAIGIVKAQEASTYMYGTHILTNDSGYTIYALRSNSINLDGFINKSVEIQGNKVAGYPVDGGPEYIEVSGVK